MIRYKVTTSAQDEDGNLTFNGKTYGIRFERGTAMFDDVTVDKNIGLTAAEIAVKMEKDFGYKVERLNMDGTPYQETESEPEEDSVTPAAKPKKK